MNNSNIDFYFLLTIFGGWLGLHRLYRKEEKIGFIYLFTFGLFGVGWIFDIYCCIYYRSDKFKKLKAKITDNTNNCNELNAHIEDLKNSFIDIKKTDYGQADYIDNSKWNFNRPELQKFQKSKYVYNCSSTVCKNAQSQPFKYICKYFNINADEETLSKFEKVLNDFSAAEQGKILLSKEREEIVASISNEIPFLINTFDKKNLIKNLGFDDIDFSQLYFPKYTFNYVSAGGNSSMRCDVTMDIENLNKFVNYLADLIKFKKSVAGQRALMTTALREKIKQRDNYTCQYCGNSTSKEPNLLLEIDHIIPLSKNGLTCEDNLQTLCWKCNRSKGSKILNNQ